MTEYIYGTDEHEGHWLTGEEIVRCRDCKHNDNDLCRENGCSYCGEPLRIEPDGFCAWALRKEVDE